MRYSAGLRWGPLISGLGLEGGIDGAIADLKMKTHKNREHVRGLSQEKTVKQASCKLLLRRFEKLGIQLAVQGQYRSASGTNDVLS